MNRLYSLLILSSLAFSQALAQNTAYGVNAGTIGSSSTHIGNSAGRVSTGSSNTFVGTYSGYNNTTGYFNTFLGYISGRNNTTGGSNTFLGTFSGRSNTTGDDNTFLGYMSGYSNTSGHNNTFLGHSSGENNTTGTDNTFLGYASGRINTSGSGNTFLGFQSGYSNTTGSRNTFLGNESGYNNTTGYFNTFLGDFSGRNNTTGGSNIFLGTFSGRSNTTGDDNTFLGYMSGYLNTSGHNNTFLGHSSGENNTTGQGNLFLGFGAGEDNSTGSGNSFLGHLADSPPTVSLSNATALGNQAYVSRSNALVLGSISGVNGATGSVNVGIGVHAPTYQLQLSTSSAAKPGASSWTIASDERLKRNITAFTDGLDLLLQFKPIKYYYNGKAGMPTEKEFVGVIAQQVQQVAPYMIGEFTYQDTTGKEETYLDYDASALTYVLVNAVKQQHEMIQAIQQENEAKDAELTLLKQELAEIKQLLVGQKTDKGSVAARLGQNVPNPANGTTSIPYFLAQSVQQAMIVLFNAKGKQVATFSLPNRGASELTLSSQQLPAGSYLYQLQVDGLPVDTKKMLIAQ